MRSDKVSGKIIRVFKISVLFLVVAILVCGTAGDNKNTMKNNNKSNNDMVDINYISCQHSSTPLLNDAPVWEEIGRRLNININFITVSTGRNYHIEIMALLASGTSADIVNLPVNIINRLGDELFVCLNDYIEEEGANLRKLLTNDVKLEIMDNDGRIFGIPLLSPVRPAYTWMLRKDYLESFGMTEPETIEDWENFWRRVSEDNKSNIIPVCPRKPDEVLRMVIFPMFGLGYSDFYLQDDKFIYAWTTDRCRKAILWLRHIYKQGFLFDKYYLMNATMWSEMVLSGNLISTQGPVFRVSFFNSNKAPNTTEFEMMAARPPMGPEGSRGMKADGHVNTSFCMAVLKDSQKIEESLKFMDYFFSDEGSVLSTWGIEGLTYNVKDGKKVWKENIYNNRHDYKYMAQYGIMLFLFPRNIDQGQYDLYMESGDSRTSFMKNKPYLLDPYPTLPYSETEAVRYQEISYNIKKIQYEYFNRYITSEMPLNDKTWAMFQNELYKNALEELIWIKNTAYSRYLKRKKLLLIEK